MKEFVGKLIQELKEESIVVDDDIGHRAVEIIEQLAEEYNNDIVNQLAMKYATCLTQYGVDITEKLETATQNAMALNQAYMRGRQDERDRFAKWQDEYNNGWIAVSERLPSKEGEYLTFVEYDDDEFIAVDEFLCEGILKEWNCTPNYRVIAWMELPEKYKEKKNGSS